MSELIIVSHNLFDVRGISQGEYVSKRHRRARRAACVGGRPGPGGGRV